VDEETWPTQLQRLTGRRVLNGGVTGYGFDQMVLQLRRQPSNRWPSGSAMMFRGLFPVQSCFN
jgi:hypothetical protein